MPNVVVSKEDLQDLLADAVAAVPRVPEGELKRIVSVAVEEVFLKFGMDVNHPLEMQQDFAFVNNLRKTTEAVKKRAILSALVLFIGAMATMLWWGFSHAVTKGQ